MAKQMYSNKTWAPRAWEALKEWLYDTPALTDLRLVRLTHFNKHDDDLHEVVAKCLWKLATQANMPWGRAASRPTGYSNVAETEKVNVGIPSRLVFVVFFFSFPYVTLTYEHVLTVTLFCVHQAWAFSVGVCMVLEKLSLMNMTNFPADTWDLHRRVFHRFLKYKKYFFKATRQLPEYKKATREEQEVKTEPLGPEPETVATQERTHTIVLLTTSEGEVSSDRDSNESEEEGTNVGDE